MTLKEQKYPAHEKYGNGKAIPCNMDRTAQIPVEDMLAISREFTALESKLNIAVEALEFYTTWMERPQGMKKLIKDDGKIGHKSLKLIKEGE